MRRKLGLWPIRLLILVAVIVCFGLTVHYYSAGLPYAAETSSNPYPSERARVMSAALMNKAKLFFKVGAAGVVIFAATFFIGLKQTQPPRSDA